MSLRTLDQLNVAQRRVLLRVDFNVPLDGETVGDDTRIQAAIPTIKQLLQRDARVIACSHLGRPKGEVRPELSLRPVAERLSELLGTDVRFADDTVGDSAHQLSKTLQPGEIGLLENLRFNSGEEQNDPDFAKELASLADCYVDDAFGAAHRAHASTEGVAHLLPAAAGLLMQREVTALTKVLEDADQPLVLILGGAKVSDKIGVIESFLDRASSILIGGGMANTFLLSEGLEIGTSLAEPDLQKQAQDLLRDAAQKQVKILLPTDVVVAAKPEATDSVQTVSTNEVPEDQSIFDIGPETVDAFSAPIQNAGTIVWNGPMGMFETQPFDAGTTAIAKAVAASDGYSLIGGGDSVAAINDAGLEDEIDHVSTGGGASLEFLEGKQLPGIAVLME